MPAFESLRYRDYRILWIGAIFSNTGTWMQSVALAWYVLLLTGSPFWVSFVTFVNFLPAVLSPVGGVLTDRVDRRMILIAAQAFMMLNAVVLAALAWAGHAGLFAVLALTFAQGLGFALHAPAWIAFVPALVPRSAMVNAIALNSAQFNLARVIGPAVAGALIVAFRPAVVFTVNAASFLAVLTALVAIRPAPPEPREERRVRHLLVGGFGYAWRNPTVRGMIASVGVLSLFAAPLTALLPVFAADVFGRGAGGYGGLAAASGAGSVVGALALGRVGNRIRPALIGAAMVGLGTALLLFAANRAYALALPLLVLFGMGFLFVVAGTNSSIMLTTEERLRGRVMSLWMLAFGLFFPTGSLLAGAAAEAIGAPLTAAIGGAACVAWGGWMLRGRPTASLLVDGPRLAGRIKAGRRRRESGHAPPAAAP